MLSGLSGRDNRELRYNPPGNHGLVKRSACLGSTSLFLWSIEPPAVQAPGNASNSQKPFSLPGQSLSWIIPLRRRIWLFTRIICPFGLLTGREFVKKVQLPLTVARLVQLLVNFRQHIVATRVG